jgi:hypothetical protein
MSSSHKTESIHDPNEAIYQAVIDDRPDDILKILAKYPDAKIEINHFHDIEFKELSYEVVELCAKHELIQNLYWYGHFDESVLQRLYRKNLIDYEHMKHFNDDKYKYDLSILMSQYASKLKYHHEYKLVEYTPELIEKFEKNDILQQAKYAIYYSNVNVLQMLLEKLPKDLNTHFHDFNIYMNMNSTTRFACYKLLFDHRFQLEKHIRDQCVAYKYYIINHIPLIDDIAEIVYHYL